MSSQLPSKLEKLEHFCGLYALKRKYIWKSSTPAVLEPVDDAVELFKIDNRPECLVAGFIDQIDASTSVFVGVDSRVELAAATKLLVDEMAAGQEAYLGDPDLREGIERWSLKGSRKAISQIRKKCS